MVRIIIAILLIAVQFSLVVGIPTSPPVAHPELPGPKGKNGLAPKSVDHDHFDSMIRKNDKGPILKEDKAFKDKKEKIVGSDDKGKKGKGGKKGSGDSSSVKGKGGKKGKKESEGSGSVKGKKGKKGKGKGGKKGSEGSGSVKGKAGKKGKKESEGSGSVKGKKDKKGKAESKGDSNDSSLDGHE